MKSSILTRIKYLKIRRGAWLAAGVLLALSLVAGALSCTGAPGLRAPSQDKGSAPSFEGPVPVPAPAPPIARPAPTPAPAPLTPGLPGQDSSVDRMIIRTGHLSLVVQDIPATIEQVKQLAERYKGYVVSSNSWREGERLRGTITIRVPAGDFENVMKLLGEMAVEVTSQTTTSQDVTEEYVDLTARLQNLQAAEQQLLRIMEKAETVEDILNVQRELTTTRGEIERIKGRMQFLERSSATSLIEVQLEQSKLDVKLTADRRFVKEGQEIRFISQVAGGFPPYSYQWDFGDKSTSTEAAPLHAYRSSGSFTVSLKVTDNRGNIDSDTMTDYITVEAGWSAGNIASSARSGLVAFGRALASIFIWLGIFSPVWIAIGAIIYWRRHRKKKA